MSQGDDQPERLLEQARRGDLAAMGLLLERYRSYLRVLTRSLIGAHLRPRVETSDVVQETFLEAYQDFSRFRGQTEPELAAWLRRALVRNIAQRIAYHQAGKRDLRRQRSLEAALDHSSRTIHAALAAPISSPSAAASRREEAVRLADALEQLPPASREVFRLRSLEQLPFETIAVLMNRSPVAVRTIWSRAVRQLSQVLEPKP